MPLPFAAVGDGLLAGRPRPRRRRPAARYAGPRGERASSRDDLRELGEHLDAGQAGLVVVAVSDMGATVERAMKRAAKLEQSELRPTRRRSSCAASAAEPGLAAGGAEAVAPRSVAGSSSTTSSSGAQ